MQNNKLQSDFEIFRTHCISIRNDYNTYNTLFCSVYDDLLKKTAHGFFYDLSEILRRDWFMQVCKLMDPAQTKRKGEIFENISIRLINIELENENLITEKILNLSATLLEYGKKVTPARNKRLAHFDRSHQINEIILGSTTEKELHDFLANLQKYCDAVGHQVGLGPLDFSFSNGSGDVYDLLKILEIHFKTEKHF